MKKNRYFLSSIIVFTTICTLSTLAQVESSIPQVFQSIYHDTSPPLRDIPEALLSPTPWKDGVVPLRKIEPNLEDKYRNDESIQNFMGSENLASIIQNWDGIASNGYAPPDPSGDVGPNHYMLATNVRFQIWNKTGTSLLGPLNLGTIWSGFSGPWASSLNDGDPIVLYDEAAGRWFIAQFSLPNYPNSPSYIIIAISKTGDPTGSWHRYGFSFNTGIPDYPKFGIWPDGYYMSANSFNPGYVGTITAAFERSKMLSGLTAQMVLFTRSSASTWSLLPSDWNGTSTPPVGAPNYFGQLHDNARYGGTDGFDIYAFSVNWTTLASSTFTGPTFLATSSYSTVNGIPQQGTSQLLDDLSVMTMNRLDYRNFGTHQSMVVCHTVDAGSGRAGMRWYEFRRTGGGWSIYQQGTYAPADGLYRWMGSIAINAGGDIALGYSVSSTSIYPAIRYTGRLSGDTPGVMTIPEETIKAGLGSQTGLNRWGDYTQMVVDPDGQTFWYVNQYQPSTGSYNWKTRIASMRFRISDPTNVSATPVSSSQINISFIPNSNNNNVIVVWNLTGTFTTPVGAPPVVGQPFAGGTLLYNGTTSPVNHTGLDPLTTYYYKAFSNNGVSYSPGVAASASTLTLTDFAVDLSVIDNCLNNTHPLIFGTAPGTTDCFDAGLDLSAPPPPPAGAIDGRFISCNEAFFTDIKGTNPDGERIWDVHYQPNAGCNPISLSWNPAQLPVDGYFHLVDPFVGTFVNVNMRTANHYTDVLGLGNLQIKFNYEIGSSFNLAGGWNMISLPVDVAGNNYLTLFPDAVPGTLYGYSGSYFSTETIENCEGYWLKFPASEFVEVSGSDRTECVLELSAGWSMIGGPNCNVPLSNVIDPGGIIIPGSLYGYSGSYSNSTSIDATKAYWIKTSSAGTVTISCSTSVVKQNKELIVLAESLNNFSRIDINDAAGNTQALYFYGKLDDNISIESFSLPPVPPPGSFDARFKGDYRLTEIDEAIIQLQVEYYPVSISVRNLSYNEEYILQEITNGVEVGSHRIADGERIVITNKEVTILKITKQQSIPTTYNLEQNYPNPFNPATTIKFSLPEAAEVTLSVYNALGEKVAELVNTSLTAGKYSYQWNAQNVATGMYIYKLRTDKFVSVKKMLLLK